MLFLRNHIFNGFKLFVNGKFMKNSPFEFSIYKLKIKKVKFRVDVHEI